MTFSGRAADLRSASLCGLPGERVYVITPEQLRDIELLRRGIDPCQMTLPYDLVHPGDHHEGGERREHETRG